MQKPKRPRGLPKALEEEEEKARLAEEHPIEDFIKDMFGGDSLAAPQDGLPSLEWLKTKFRTKSAAIRYLTNQGHPVKTIAKHLGIRYQHARNVAKQQLKRGPNEDWTKPYKEAEAEAEAEEPQSPPTTIEEEPDEPGQD